LGASSLRGVFFPGGRRPFPWIIYFTFRLK
jgi:hypothetical protein